MMRDIKVSAPTLAELLDRVPDRHLLTAVQLMSAIGKPEAKDVFAHFTKAIANDHSPT